jgi:hypothetical protein
LGNDAKKEIKQILEETQALKYASLPNVNYETCLHALARHNAPHLVKLVIDSKKVELTEYQKNLRDTFQKLLDEQKRFKMK